MKNIYENIKKQAVHLLLDMDIKQYPIDVYYIVEKLSNCRLETYTNYARECGVRFHKVIKFFQSDDSCVVCNAKNKYIIFYNDLLTSKQRINWNIAHELGHIILKHLEDDNCKISNNLKDDIYKKYEYQANIFASELLANLYILDKYNIVSAEDISNICNMSNQAARIRFKSYENWKPNKNHSHYDILLCENFHFDRNLLEKELSFEETVLTNSKIDNSHMKSTINTFSGYCKNCGNMYKFINQVDYCCICGDSLKLSIREEDKMLYEDGYELDNRGKAKMCPVCKNEEMYTGTYCLICGTYLINKCSDENCGEIANGNARYCEYCGESTTFYNDNLLEHFENVQNNDKCTAVSFNDDLPF